MTNFKKVIVDSSNHYKKLYTNRNYFIMSIISVSRK